MDAFRDSFADRGPMGAALSVWIDGRQVVDVWGGVTAGNFASQWTATTTTVVFSCTKALLAILAARLVQEGRLDYEAPVAHYWPEFAQAGKEDVLVKHVLAHQAGLSAPRRSVSTDQAISWPFMTELLASQRPLWTPGTAHEYHALTFGWLVGELIRRVSGRSVGDALQEIISQPLNAEIWIGVPPEQSFRVAELLLEEGSETAHAAAGERTPQEPDWGVRSLTLGGAFPVELAGPGTGFNDPRVRAAEIAGAGGIATSRSLAKAMSATVVRTDGVRLLDDAILARATAPVTLGPPAFGRPPPWSKRGLGFQLPSPGRGFLSPRSFGHDGAGGQIAFADPDARLGFAYLTNRLEAGPDGRGASIINALRRVLC
ncbi:beta-lactamase family protein [Herbiconiux moechotypicola]|nr:serine hydrolase domain-containing protein [Herbiconiux moechotypicola]MCS5731665.1 beta-lactamase family protein [Herbiconiux moechotypicola]